MHTFSCSFVLNIDTFSKKILKDTNRKYKLLVKIQTKKNRLLILNYFNCQVV